MHTSLPRRQPGAIPARAGIGLRAPHYRELLDTLPDIGWLEVHSENYFGEGGQPLYFLERLREHYPLSLHGVGLCLGNVDAPDREHLRRLNALATRFEPGLISEHLCWGAFDGRYLHDLVPLPYTEEALAVVSRHIAQTQDYLGRRILIENVSSYLQFKHSTLSEWDFLAAVSRNTGCGILLDVNNIYVSSVNHGFDPQRFLDAMPAHAIAEIHLAGFEKTEACLIDTHGRNVADPVWDLYYSALQRFGPVPSLIEWDTDIPPLEILLDEARIAEAFLQERHDLAA